MKKNYLFIIIASTLLFSGCSLLQTRQTLDTNQKNIDNKNEHINNELNLSNKSLQKIPEYVFDKKSLEELDISNNQLTGAIQGEIRHLENLKVLDASNNHMTGVPAEIGQLSKLQILNLSNNQLTGLPYELGNLKNLKTLNISDNQYSEIDLSIIIEKLPKETSVIK